MAVISPIQFALGVGASGALVDVSSYVEYGEGIFKSYGKVDQYRDTAAGTFTVTLSNRDGRFTPNNSSSAYAAAGTLVTEGMAAVLLIGSRLTAATVQSIALPADELTWGQITLTCDDMLGNAARRAMVSPFVDAIASGSTPLLSFPLSDAAGTAVPTETTGNGAALLQLVGANGSAFGQTAITGLTAATQLSLKDQLRSTGAAWPTFTFGYTGTSAGFYSAWITPTNLTSSKVTIAVSLSGVSTSMQFGLTTNNAFFIRNGDAGTLASYSSADLSAGIAHFVSMGLTYSGTTLQMTLFVDGTSRGTVAVTGVTTFAYRAPTGISVTAVS